MLKIRDHPSHIVFWAARRSSPLLSLGRQIMEKPHKRLLAWRKSMDLVVKSYDLTKAFPRDEIYGLTSQIRRAYVSVPSNISEGAAGQANNSETTYPLPSDR